MRVLVVAATEFEIAPLPRYPSVEVLVTGVGMVATAARTSAALARTTYALALNLGLCGSFDPTVAVGSVVHVVSDTIPELGAEDGDAFLTIADLGLQQADTHPFSDGWLVNEAVPPNPVLRTLAAVRGITVNTVHGNDRSIADTVRRLAPQVESMEGAGFMYACLMHNALFAQVRAVSNVVERRNRAAWKIDEAIANLCRAGREIIDAV